MNGDPKPITAASASDAPQLAYPTTLPEDDLELMPSRPTEDVLLWLEGEGADPWLDESSSPAASTQE